MSRAALMLFIARAVSALATVTVLAVVARLGSPEELGVVALGLSIGLALAVIPEAGLTALLIREVARRPEGAGTTLGAILLSRAIALPLVSVALFVLLAIVYPAYAPTLLIIALGPAFQQVGELARAVFLARGRAGIASAHSIVENIAWLVAIIASLTAGVGLAESFIVALSVLVVVETFAYLLLAIVVRVRVARPDRPEIRDLFGQAGPFVAFGALMVVASRSETILVASLLPDGLVVAGAYFAVARLVGAGEFLPEAVSRAIFPEISRRYVEAPASIHDVLAPAARQLLAISIAIPFGLALAGEWLLDLVYGSDLAKYGGLLVVLAAVLPFRYISILFGMALTGADGQAWRTAALATAVAVSVVLQLVLIPLVGLAGAIVGVYAVWTTMAVLVTRAVTGRLGPIILPRDVIWPLATATAAFAIGWLIVATGVPLAEPLAGTVFAVVIVPSLLVMARRPVPVRTSGSAP